MIIETATVYALSALALSMIIISVYFMIFFLVFFVAGYLILLVFKPIIRILQHL